MRAGAPGPRRTPRPVFRPHFLLVLLYLGTLWILFALAFALPDLVEGARALGPGPAELTPAELERAIDLTREALQGGRLLVAFAAAALVVGVGAWFRLLPGLR